MQVRPGRAAGGADPGNGCAGIHDLALLDEEGAQVAVARYQPRRVRHFDEVAIAGALADEGYLAMAGALHGGASRGREVDAGVKGTATGERVPAVAETRTDPRRS